MQKKKRKKRGKREPTEPVSSYEEKHTREESIRSFHGYTFSFAREIPFSFFFSFSSQNLKTF